MLGKRCSSGRLATGWLLRRHIAVVKMLIKLDRSHKVQTAVQTGLLSEKKLAPEVCRAVTNLGHMVHGTYH